MLIGKSVQNIDFFCRDVPILSESVLVSVVSAFLVSIGIGIDHCHDTSIGIGIGIDLHHEYLVSVSVNQKMSLICRYSDTGTLGYSNIKRFPCIQAKRVSNNYDVARQNNEAEVDGA